ncbi:DUF2971 domain-containing protein [Rheinheimera soli]|uniref:DUF2971 domain-containing protein n=1 Tax=Rheinheimera soli TaxID=443616 RepID=UPI001E43E33F|nr:DUF2971 domain-containing protein [Rheinheimera soli]
MSIPKKLYKYESVSTQTLANLKNGQIYFSLPSQFNDPFDCSLPISLDLSSDSLTRFRASLLERGNLPEFSAKQLDGMSDSSLLEILDRAMHETLGIALQGKGVSCFSSDFCNLLMWSHYGAKHTGFCLEFDTSFEPFSKARKVKYVDQFPKLNAEELVVDTNYERALELLHTKSNAWSYENEWRCIHAEAPIAYAYHQRALTGVYFGSQIDNALVEIICLTLQGQNPDVRFWSGKKCSDKFGLEFEEFFYTPHIKAKELGVI